MTILTNPRNSLCLKCNSFSTNKIFFVREIEVVYVRFSYVCYLTWHMVTVLLFTLSQRISISHRFSVESLRVSLLIGGWNLMRKGKENVFSLPDPAECLLCCLSVCLSVCLSQTLWSTQQCKGWHCEYVDSFLSNQITSKAFTTMNKFRIILTLTRTTLSENAHQNLWWWINLSKMH